jgi:hypothetical protein
MPIMIHSFNPTRALVLILTLLALPLAVAACSWQVPADPGLNYQQRVRTPAVASTPMAPAAAGQPPALAQDAGARALYMNHCSRCHAPFAPSSLRAGQWPMYVRKYAPRAQLFGADRARVLAWLQANAQ